MSNQNWRWNVAKHPQPTKATISVIEPTAADAEARRKTEEKKMEDGAERAAFGFSRALDD